ncbi:MAG: hypothetical protein PHI03_04065 [Bacteroidales bacterium]|nr:hypothetical protein [Bacteroidales bacterium]
MKPRKTKESRPKKYSSLQRSWDRLILSLYDCDGMCNLCNPTLKSRCFRFKGIDEENPPYPGLPKTSPQAPK